MLADDENPAHILRIRDGTAIAGKQQAKEYAQQVLQGTLEGFQHEEGSRFGAEDSRSGVVALFRINVFKLSITNFGKLSFGLSPIRCCMHRMVFPSAWLAQPVHALHDPENCPSNVTKQEEKEKAQHRQPRVLMGL